VTRALVLGGGGPVGVAWEAGLLVGLGRGGAAVAEADAVIGTSAGAVVGCILASGGDLTQVTSLVATAFGAEHSQLVAQAAGPLDRLISVLAQSALRPQEAARLWAQLGSEAAAAETMSEGSWLKIFQTFAAVAWPPGFACTAVSAADGCYQVWDQSCGIDVQHAVASSCAFPLVFPLVTISGRRWMDGGVRDFLNADAAAGHDVVLAISCGLLDIPSDFGIPAMELVMGATRARLEALRDDGARVTTIVPNEEMLQLSGWGQNLMDVSRANAAYQAGTRQGEAEASHLRTFWPAHMHEEMD